MKNNKKFELAHSPTAYIVSVHVRNLIATYGEEEVRHIIKDLFLQEKQVKSKINKKAL